MPWGSRLIPVDDLNRLMVEQRRPAQPQSKRPRHAGRPAVVPMELVRHIHEERVAGKSLGRIARDLNATGTATAHGRAQWLPSTVRAVLRRGLDSVQGTRGPVARSIQRSRRRAVERSFPSTFAGTARRSPTISMGVPTEPASTNRSSAKRATTMLASTLDGELLRDLWKELVLPSTARHAWTGGPGWHPCGA